MATSPNHCSTYDYTWRVNPQPGGSESGGVTRETHDMEVKGHLITGPELQGYQDSKQRAERMCELQERRRGLQALLNTRLAELRRVCLKEAEFTGEVANEFPLEAGERLPYVRRRVGSSRHGPKHNAKGEEEEVSQRKTKKTLFSSALRRHVDSEQHPAHGKRTVHRGCHTDNTVKSESSSMSDSTSQENEDAPDCLSPSRPRLAPGSPDSRFCRKLSPVEIYYEMRTRRNSVASSASPSRSLPRSMSNMEGRSVPATPLMSRTGPTSSHIRSDVSSGAAVKQWSDNPEVPPVAPPPPQEGSRACRSNSSEALLDRAVAEEAGAGGPRPSLPSRGVGPYKSSEALSDGRLRQAQRGSPDHLLNGHAELGRTRSSVGGRGGGGGGGGGYSEILMDYVWEKQQKMQVQQQQQQQQRRQQSHSGVGKPHPWPEGSPAPPPYLNGISAQPPHLSVGPPAYSSPLLLRGKPGEPRRVKVTRTKSCGPFIPLQQQHQAADGVLLSAHAEAASPGSAGAPTPGLYPSRQTELPAAPLPGHRPPHYPAEPGTPDEPPRSLHKALALEGLRDWYLRNTLGHSAVTAATAVKGQDGGGPRPRRRRTTNSLHPNSHSHPPPPLTHQHQHQPFQGDAPYPQMPQSATFHGHPLHGRSMELSLYQESFPSQMQELTLKESSADRPTPGTLV